MALIALLFRYAGVSVFVVTLCLTVWRYAILREMPRRPFNWMTVADWMLFSVPGLSAR